MSYFDNANNQVTRKSFGSKVDKTFQREGVVPLKDRKKNNGVDLAQESAKYNELNKNISIILASSTIITFSSTLLFSSIWKVPFSLFHFKNL